MSKYEDQMDSCNCICPYCLEEYQVESEVYSETERIEECESCGMKYTTHQEFDVTNYAVPDCELNGLEHSYELQKVAVGTFEKSVYYCTVCGKIKPTTLDRILGDKNDR